MATINTLNTWTNIASTVWDFGSTKITYYLDAMITSQDTVNNKSYIKTKLRSELHYGWASSQNYTFTCSYAPTVSGTNSWYSGTEDITVSTSSQEIAHNSDGTKTISLSARAYMSGVGDTTFSGNATLKAIPRASKFTSETSVTIANNGAIDIYPTFSKAVSSYYQTLSIKTTDQSATLFTLNNVSSGTHYYPDATQRQQMYNYIGTSDRYVFSLVLNTYTSNGGTLVGTDLVKKVPILPSYTISLTASSITDTVTTYNTYKGTGNENKIYIANLSKPQFTLSATSSTGSYYGRSVSYKLGSTVITSPYTVTSYTGQSLSFTATDGRKTSNTYTPSSPSFVSIPYFSPTLNATIVRTTSTGSTIDVTINGTYYDGDGLTNLNNTSITLKYTEEGGTEQTVTIPYTVSTSGHTVSFNATYQLTGMNYQKSVQWSITIFDKLNITKTTSGTVIQGLPLWNGYRNNDRNYMVINGNEVVGNDFQVKGNVVGQLKKNTGSSWIGDRDNAIVKGLITSGSGAYFPVISQKTATGNWTIGNLSDSNTNNNLLFNYTTDTNYSGGTNASTRFALQPDGYFGVRTQCSTNLQSTGRITNANITHSYENNLAHLRFLQVSSSMTSNKPPSGDGFILHCAWDNDGQYNFQLALPDNYTSPICARGCSNGTWGTWDYLYRGKSLYDNSTGTNGTVTLSESSANFSVLEIFYRHTDDGTEYGSTRVFAPNGKRANLELSWGFTASGVVGCQTLQKNMNISGTSITNYSGRAFNVQANGSTWAGSTTSGIYVTKVIGYR